MNNITAARSKEPPKHINSEWTLRIKLAASGTNGMYTNHKGRFFTYGNSGFPSRYLGPEVHGRQVNPGKQLQERLPGIALVHRVVSCFIVSSVVKERV